MGLARLAAFLFERGVELCVKSASSDRVDVGSPALAAQTVRSQITGIGFQQGGPGPRPARKLEGLGWRVASVTGSPRPPHRRSTLPMGTSSVRTTGSRRPDQHRLPAVTEGARTGTFRREGEILARGRNVFSGYRNRPEETSKVFDSGWLRTGDLGYFDDDGYLYVTGRASTLIDLRARTFSPKPSK